mmetsp:Transcript_41382/g.97605  ORF Transcript_41382/g.97605 Transcript_41382/m.97605 type:complete len:211 (-) Transcript_41382:9-641(-)
MGAPGVLSLNSRGFTLAPFSLLASVAICGGRFHVMSAGDIPCSSSIAAPGALGSRKMDFSSALNPGSSNLNPWSVSLCTHGSHATPLAQSATISACESFSRTCFSGKSSSATAGKWSSSFSPSASPSSSRSSSSSSSAAVSLDGAWCCAGEAAAHDRARPKKKRERPAAWRGCISLGKRAYDASTDASLRQMPMPVATTAPTALMAAVKA